MDKELKYKKEGEKITMQWVEVEPAAKPERPTINDFKAADATEKINERLIKENSITLSKWQTMKVAAIFAIITYLLFKYL